MEPVRPEEEFEYTANDNLDFDIYRDENGAFVVVGGLVDMLCRNVVLNNPDSMLYFQKVLRLRGVIKKLTEMGCKEGDTVSIGEDDRFYSVIWIRKYFFRYRCGKVRRCFFAL